MLKQVVSITEELDNQTNWFPHYAEDFEKSIHEIIANDLIKKYGYENCKIVHTPTKRDDGKDIVITSKCSIDLMGIHLPKNVNKDSLKCVIECKTTQSQNRISLEKISKNVLVADEEKDIDYFILVVNTTITPHAYYEVQRYCDDKNIKFHLVNQYILAKYLKNCNVNECTYHFLEKVSNQTIEYQICNGRLDGNNCFEIYLYIRNNLDKALISGLELQTDRNWELIHEPKEIALNVNESICEKMIISKQYNDGSDDVKVDFTINDGFQQIIIKNAGISLNFETPFCGNGHNEIKKKLVTVLRDNDKFSFHLLCGEAGIGKTRILDELIKDFSTGNYGIFHEFYNKNNHQQVIKKVLNWCYTNEYISNKHECNDLTTLRFLKNEYIKLLIVIEDVHHADKDFFDSIIKLINYKDTISIPIELILTARDDYTFFNEDFLAFKNKIELYDENSILYVKPLDEKECKNLIRNIIKEIPEAALEKIYIYSKQNPFYVVQFIEYMLDLDLVSIVNRNTVGIINLEKFTSNDYLPEKIEELISSRVEILKSVNKQCYDFLLVCSYFGYSFDTQLMYDFFSEDDTALVDMMIERHFLKLTNNGMLAFDHETIYIYFQNIMEQDMVYTANLIHNKVEGCIEFLTKFQKGKYYLNIDKKSEARDCFIEIIDFIAEFKNISSENIPKTYEPYLLSVYDLTQDKNLKGNILKALLYINIHHFSFGHSLNRFEIVYKKLEQQHKGDKQLETTIKQMQAHFYLNNSMLLYAEKYLLELQMIVKLHPSYFTTETKFELFDRLASLYTRYNYHDLALMYAAQAKKEAKKSKDNKLIALNLMMYAKINYYRNPAKANAYYKEVLAIYAQTPVKRLECQVKLGESITRFFTDKKRCLSDYISHTHKIYEQSINENYPITIIRCCLSLSVYFYLEDNLKKSLEYADKGINISVSTGISKIIPYFYNIKAIIADNLNDFSICNKYFNTMIYFLRQQHLLFLGATQYCYPNMALISNYISFIAQYQKESQVFAFYDSLTYYHKTVFENSHVEDEKGLQYSDHEKIKNYEQDVQHIKKGYIVFSSYCYPIKDKTNQYNLVQF